MIRLGPRVVIKVTDPHGYHVGYFRRPEDINHHGMPVELADLVIISREREASR